MKKPENPPNWKSEPLSPEFPGLLDNVQIANAVKNALSKYLYWEELKYHFSGLPIDYKKLWAIIKLFRTQQYKHIKIGEITFNYFLTEIAQEKLHFIDSHAGLIIGSESSLGRFQAGERKKYLINSLMEEAIASSQMEGAMTTRKVAKEMLRTRRKPKSNSEQMIYNNYQTITFIKELFESNDQKNKQLTQNAVLSIHKKMTNGTLSNQSAEGKFRQSNDITVEDSLTGEIMHVPPNANKIPQLMQDFCDLANSQSPFIHPIIKAIALHFLIGYIHPFEDGNGRTARAIFYWSCLKAGYWTFEYMPISRIIKRAYTQYAKAYLYTENDELDLNYFIHYNLEAIAKAINELDDYLKQKQKERTEALQLMTKVAKHLSLRQSLILKDFIEEPEKIITIQETQTKYNVTYQTARTDLLDLAKKGYLAYQKKQKQFLFYKSAQFEEKIKTT
ncbi:MAG TPA: Fic family protein [archaeon]|nr:Fic family protein [archaeon]